jgi:peptidoglycan hydrolase CwlO-like protein
MFPLNHQVQRNKMNTKKLFFISFFAFVCIIVSVQATNPEVEKLQTGLVGLQKSLTKAGSQLSTMKTKLKTLTSKLKSLKPKSANPDEDSDESDQDDSD